MRGYGSNSRIYLSTEYDKTVKRTREKIGGKKEPTGFIYLLGSQFCQAKRNLKLRSCLHDAVLNAAPRIGKFADKNEFYRQCFPIHVKGTNTNKFENAYCVSSVMAISPVI